MQSIGETEILIEATIVGKVRVQNVSALAALQPRISLVVGVDLDPIHGSLHSGQARPDQYWLTELRGDLRLSDKGPSIGIVHWIGAHHEIRSQPYPSESQLQLACDLDPGTLERLETARGGNDLALWIELWPRIEHPGGYLSASIRGFSLAVPRVEWLQFLEGELWQGFRVRVCLSSGLAQAGGLRPSTRLSFPIGQSMVEDECAHG